MQASTSIMKALVTLLLVVSVVAVSHGANPYLTYPLRLRSDGGDDVELLQGITCSAWRYAVDTNNIINWKTVPAECEGYVKNYFDSHKYQDHSKAVNREAYFYARDQVRTTSDIWIFDVDDTAISNLPYYEKHGYGTEVYNHTAFDEWLEQGVAPVLPETIKLYDKLLSLRIKIVFITERSEKHREITSHNLRTQGYRVFHKLITKGPAYLGVSSGEFKKEQRMQLEKLGYRIVGSTGDQWSDFLGGHAGRRTFKLPNPLYYL